MHLQKPSSLSLFRLDLDGKSLFLTKKLWGCLRPLNIRVKSQSDMNLVFIHIPSGPLPLLIRNTCTSWEIALLRWKETIFWSHNSEPRMLRKSQDRQTWAWTQRRRTEIQKLTESGDTSGSKWDAGSSKRISSWMTWRESAWSLICRRFRWHHSEDDKNRQMRADEGREAACTYDVRHRRRQISISCQRLTYEERQLTFNHFTSPWLPMLHSQASPEQIHFWWSHQNNVL